MYKKLGPLGSYEFHYKLNDLWEDKTYSGLGWQVLVSRTPPQAFLTDPVCLKCKTDLISKVNSQKDGFYLECTDCKIKFEVSDIGEVRALANASLQGVVRKSPKKFFY